MGLGRGRRRQWGQRTLTGILRKPLSDNKRTPSSWTGTHNSNTGTPGKKEAEPSAFRERRKDGPESEGNHWSMVPLYVRVCV